jgi:hypothetical protein
MVVFLILFAFYVNLHKNKYPSPKKTHAPDNMPGPLWTNCAWQYHRANLLKLNCYLILYMSRKHNYVVVFESRHYGTLAYATTLKRANRLLKLEGELFYIFKYSGKTEPFMMKLRYPLSGNYECLSINDYTYDECVSDDDDSDFIVITRNDDQDGLIVTVRDS